MSFSIMMYVFKENDTSGRAFLGDYHAGQAVSLDMTQLALIVFAFGCSLGSSLCSCDVFESRVFQGRCQVEKAGRRVRKRS